MSPSEQQSLDLGDDLVVIDEAVDGPDTIEDDPAAAPGPTRGRRAAAAARRAPGASTGGPLPPAAEPDSTVHPAGPAAGQGFGAEYRQLARQRRFERHEASAAAPQPAGTPRWRPAAEVPVDEGARRAAADLRPVRAAEQSRAAQAPFTGRRPAGVPVRASQQVDRLTRDPYSVLVELSRMADRVIEAREALAREQVEAQQVVAHERARSAALERELALRTEALERELAARTEQLGTANDRILAARGLVHEAQRTARQAVERCEFLEGRCEALEEALDMSLNASLIQRWKWRRRMKRGSREV